jgi:hypothetical protein
MRKVERRCSVMNFREHWSYVGPMTKGAALKRFGVAKRKWHPGLCPHCWRTVAVTEKGKMHIHGFHQDGTPACKGSGQFPINIGGEDVSDHNVGRDAAARDAALEAVPLVKFKCGCLGFPPHKDGYAILLETCDHRVEDPQLWGGARNMEGKTFEPLKPEERVRLWTAVFETIGKGNRFDQIKDALR